MMSRFYFTFTGNLSRSRCPGDAATLESVADPNFLHFGIFSEMKITFGSLCDINSSLNPRVSVRTHGSKITHLGATNLGFEVLGHAQQGILGGTDMAGTSERADLGAKICGSDLGAMILAPSLDSETTTKFYCLSSFVPPPSRVLALYRSKYIMLKSLDNYN
jgi:hypothetical protein